MTDEVRALWFVAVEIALRTHDCYSSDEGTFYGEWQEELILSQDLSTERTK